MPLDYNPDEGFVLDKLEAAKRQIEAAINLWFHGGDPIAIHTLTSACHRIVLDLCDHRKISPSFIFHTKLVKPELIKEYKRLIRKAETFFKHAKDDPHDTLKFNPAATEIYLLDAVEMFLVLNGTITPLMVAFRFRLHLLNPGIFADDAFDSSIDPLRVQLRSLSGSEFLNVFLKEFKRRGGK